MARKPVTAALAPGDWTPVDAFAVRALAAGNATDVQQRRALDWIIRAAAKTYDASFSPVSDRETSFAEGRRYVGLQIVKLLNLPVEIIKGNKPHDGG